MSRLVARVVTALFWAGLSSSGALAQANFVQNFDSLTPVNSDQWGPANLISQGWMFRMQCSPPSVEAYDVGHNTFFSPHSGAGFLSVDAFMQFSGPVSNWAILPAIPNQVEGDEFSMWVRRLGALDPRFEIRYSPTGGTSTGSGPNDVGDFTQLLLTIHPVPTAGWAAYTTTVPGAGRLAIRFAGNYQNFAGGMYCGIDTLSVGPPPPPPCNLPPIPSIGEAVTWSLAAAPYSICSDVVIPSGSTVYIEPGVTLNIESGRTLGISGTVIAQGAANNHVTFNATAVFPPMIEVLGGTLEADYTDFNGQVRPKSASQLLLSNCSFVGSNGLMWTDGASSGAPWTQAFLSLDQCTFTNTLCVLSDCLTVMRDCTFINTTAQALRGFIMTDNLTMNGAPLQIIRERNIQPLYVDGVNASGFSTGGGLELDGGNYLLGPNNTLSGNLYPVQVRGGLMPGSIVPTSGNSTNKISLANGGSLGNQRWSKLSLDYLISGWINGGGNVTVDPGVRVEFAGGAGLPFSSTRRLIAEGLPEAPITFTGANGAMWGGLEFHTNGSTGPKLVDCIVERAQFGAAVDDTGVHFENCIFRNNAVGTNSNTFGVQYARKSQYLNNTVGVQTSTAPISGGSADINGTTNPNFFQGNSTAVQNQRQTTIPAQYNWWAHASGPQSPNNPGGSGQLIGGAYASMVQVLPFLTSPPDINNHPPVVRLVEPARDYRAYSPQPQFWFKPGEKYIIHWEASDDDPGGIVEQRIYFSPEGNYLSSYTMTVATGLPATQRSFVWTVPDIGYAVTHQPQFLKVVAIDAAGQHGWDDMPLTVSSNDLGASMVVQSSHAGQTFIAGQPIPPPQYTGTPGNGLADGEAVLEADGTLWDTSHVSTDRARVAVRAALDSNRVEWFFAEGYFSIRHDPRLGLTPPTVTLNSPNGGTFGANSVVQINWSASAPEGMYGFDIQVSYNSGRTWPLLVKDLPPGTTSYQWKLPPVTEHMSDVRVRVVAHDVRFQNSAADSGPLTIVPGGVAAPGDVNGDGVVNVVDLLAILSGWGACPAPPAACPADFNGDGMVNVIDLLVCITNWT